MISDVFFGQWSRVALNCLGPLRHVKVDGGSNELCDLNLDFSVRRRRRLIQYFSLDRQCECLCLHLTQCKRETTLYPRHSLLIAPNYVSIKLIVITFPHSIICALAFARLCTVCNGWFDYAIAVRAFARLRLEHIFNGNINIVQINTTNCDYPPAKWWTATSQSVSENETATRTSCIHKLNTESGKRLKQQKSCFQLQESHSTA